MAVQIIDGFRLGTSRPIDDRIVGFGPNFRDGIVYKYDGLLVVDTKDHKPYVWRKSDNTWIDILSSVGSGGSGSGSGGSSTIVNGDTTYVGNTQQVYIGGSGSNTQNVYIGDSSKISDLNVSGIISGNGSGITNISPSNISGGDEENQVLQMKKVGGNLKPTWSTITTGGGGNLIAAASYPNANYYIGFIENQTGSVSKIYHNAGIGLQSGVFYLNEIGLSSSSATITNLTSTNGTIGTLTSTNGTIGNLTSTNGTITNLTSTTGTFSNRFYTPNGTIDNLTSTTSTITNLTSTIGTFSNRVYTPNGAITDLTSTNAKFNKIWILDGTTNGAANGKFLTCNSMGEASWASIPISKEIPNGAIIMWFLNNVPTGYKLCNGIGFIFINGSYRDIPNLNGLNITGAQMGVTNDSNSTISDIGFYGSRNASTDYSFKIIKANLPKHSHKLKGSLYTDKDGKHAHRQQGTFITDTKGSHTHDVYTYNNGTGTKYIAESGNSNGFRTHGGNIASAGAHTHSVTISGITSEEDAIHKHSIDLTSATTDDGIDLNNTDVKIPAPYGYKLVFLIKYDPNAAPGTEGAYSVSNTSSNDDILPPTYDPSNIYNYYI
jgi:hypothetical protein